MSLFTPFLEFLKCIELNAAAVYERYEIYYRLCEVCHNDNVFTIYVYTSSADANPNIPT